MLGCYLVDYGRKEGMPVALMERQCELGLRWLKERRIEGIIFLGNTTMTWGSLPWTGLGSGFKKLGRLICSLFRLLVTL
jgi:hypothetical protein